MKTTQEFLNHYVSAGLTVDGIIGNKSHKAILTAKDKLKQHCEKYKLQWNEKFMFIGLRTDDDLDNTFDDWFIIWTSGTMIAVPASTVSGVQGVFKYMNSLIRGKKGVGTIAENQQIDYLLVQPGASTWHNWTGGLGFLYQDKPINVYRGAYQDNGVWKIDKTNLVKGDIGGGFNVHSWANYLLSLVNNLSEGCQVTIVTYWKIIFPILVKNAINNRITYTILQ